MTLRLGLLDGLMAVLGLGDCCCCLKRFVRSLEFWDTWWAVVAIER